ncbi:DNA-3-methyladenine glycosylase [Jatrophihabitans endophyticus]|uniref:Putative 3-methyladenine DNA glycosylase n=1 Tax=Jatrophihabitans endophyticus TaxID=1206085 RepID=A0A1M5MN85_9ACTN|nr:DNA-3-methyladenine glycosylase [Jatrophihabitans endophyticus]
MIDRARLAVPARVLAPRLVGALLASEIGGARVAVRLTEVEAYEGADDPASHAFRGPTPRTRVMFGPAGHLYCYFSYGMHWCANVVCGPDGVAAAVLVRAGEVVEGVDAARSRRPASRRDTDLARGPARLASCLGLAAAVNGVDLCDPGSPVRLETLPVRRRPGVRAGPRVGISRAVERPWRFWLEGAPSVSAYKAGGRKPLPSTRQTDGRE